MKTGGWIHNITEKTPREISRARKNTGRENARRRQITQITLSLAYFSRSTNTHYKSYCRSMTCSSNSFDAKYYVTTPGTPESAPDKMFVTCPSWQCRRLVAVQYDETSNF